jgi:hypothetical protein
MSEQIKIRGKFLTADETAEVLGIPKKRAKWLISLFRDPANGGSKKKDIGEVSYSPSPKRAAKAASGPWSGNSKSGIRYALKKAVGKKAATKSASK